MNLTCFWETSNIFTLLINRFVNKYACAALLDVGKVLGFVEYDQKISESNICLPRTQSATVNI